MSDHAKFDFDNEFTPGAPHPDDDPHAFTDPADIPAYSQNQLDAALAASRNEGAVEASDEATRNADAVANQTLAAIEVQFARLGTFQDSFVKTIHSDAVELALVIGQKLARSLMAKEPVAEVEALVLEMLQQHSEIGSTPRIVVRVHPVVEPKISARIEALKNNVAFTGEVTILPAEGLGPTDCTVEWSEGGAVRNLKQLEDEVTNTVRRYLGAISASSETTEHAPQNMPEPTDNTAPAENASVVDVQQPVSVIDEIAADAQQAAAVQEQGS